MWLFTKFGFFSITRTEEDAQEFQIRARLRADLVALLTAVSRDPCAGGRSVRDADRDLQEWVKNIIVLPERDYRYRYMVTSAALAYFMGVLVDNLDYSNFKAAVAATPGQAEKEPDLHTIWSIHHRWQVEEKRPHIPIRPGTTAARLLGGQYSNSAPMQGYGGAGGNVKNQRPPVRRKRLECVVCGDPGHHGAHCPTLRGETGGFE